MAIARKASSKTPTAQTAASQPASEPQDALPLLRKAASLGVPSTLVFGNAGTGKSTLVRDTLLAAKCNPVWLPLNNTGALDTSVADWDVAIPSDWREFHTGVYLPALRGELSGHNAIVIDGLNVLIAYALASEAPTGRAEQSDWLLASNKLRDALVKLRDVFGELYALVDVVYDKSGTRKIDMNPYSRNVLLPLFGNKWYTHVVKERDGNNKLTGNLLYTVQRISSLSLDFTPGLPLTE